jgi:protein-S-isoprenylcysteine O-methyltransferase Ste14
MNASLQGWVLVVIQFICLGLLFGYPMVFPVSPAGKLFFYSGMLLGIWAIVAMPPASLTIHPVPKTGGSLAFKGPYRLIRHPMYAAVILVSFSQLFDYFGLKNVSCFIILTGALIAKIIMEEKLLVEKYSGFAAYQQKTKKIIPFVW